MANLHRTTDAGCALSSRLLPTVASSRDPSLPRADAARCCARTCQARWDVNSCLRYSAAQAARGPRPSSPSAASSRSARWREPVSFSRHCRDSRIRPGCRDFRIHQRPADAARSARRNWIAASDSCPRSGPSDDPADSPAAAHSACCSDGRHSPACHCRLERQRQAGQRLPEHRCLRGRPCRVAPREHCC